MLANPCCFTHLARGGRALAMSALLVIDDELAAARMATDPRFQQIHVVLVTGAHRPPPTGLVRVVAVLRNPFLFDALLPIVTRVVTAPGLAAPG